MKTILAQAYWQPFVDFLDRMVAEGMIDRRDLALALVTDDLDEAMRHIQQRTAEQFGLSLAVGPAALKGCATRENRPAPAPFT